MLDEIAHGQGMTAPKFLSTLYDEALEINGHISNFASMLRTTCATGDHSTAKRRN
ncbi:MAG: hypothetical protein E5X63_02525 [Mesorhizobium sp.]|nr:MAG: hypothetical protein E5X63_02525 [Mesorhizobium sp.]TJW50916.1 MAG: hypothetical protein E5X65_25810 [Mesorhizobium sp.]